MLAAILTISSVEAGVAAQVPQIPSFLLSKQKIEQGDTLVVILQPYSHGRRTVRTVVRVFGKNFRPDTLGIVYIKIDPNTKPGKYTICLVEYYTPWYCTNIEVLAKPR